MEVPTEPIVNPPKPGPFTDIILRTNPFLRRLGVAFIILIIVGCVAFIAGVFLYMPPPPHATPPKTTSNQASPSATVSSSSEVKTVINAPIFNKVTPETSVVLFSGHIKRLEQNLKVLKSTGNDTLNGRNINDVAVYYEAGKFLGGELKDYTRIIAIRPSFAPRGPLVFVLATKDFQSYVLNSQEGYLGEGPVSDADLYEYLDKNKILSVKSFGTELPRELLLNNDFALYSENIPTTAAPITDATSKDKFGQPNETDLLVTDFSKYQKLYSPLGNLTIYFNPYVKDDTADFYNNLDKEGKNTYDQKMKYLLADTEVVVVDSTGLPVFYALTTPKKNPKLRN